MTIAVGEHFGRYQIRGLIGEGGMGHVYRATDSVLGRDVAIKILRPDLAITDDRLRRFEREARASSALSHPNIVAVYDVGSHGDMPFVVSELLEGETIRQRLQSGPLPLRKCIDYACQIARGLAAAHAKGIVHRDVKPENLFITRDGHVKILDFGLAKLMPMESRAMEQSHAHTSKFNTQISIVVGTAGYMSPEGIRGRPTDHRSDIFVFGAVLYEMIAGRRVFQGNSPFEAMNAILNDEPSELSDVNRSTPPALERIVHRCLEKNPDDRFQSTRDLLFDLEGLASGSATAKMPPIVSGTTRTTFTTLRAAASVAVLIAGVLVAGVLIGRYTVASELPTYTQLTFRRGTTWSARFAADGNTIVYSGAWNGSASDLFTARSDSRESRPLGLQNADILAVSSTGDMAILLDRHYMGPMTQRGTLAVMPLGGGAPRELLEDVEHADWAPDGRNLAVVHYVGGRNRLEFPIGKVLYETAGWISHPRISPKGDRIAFLDHQVQWDDRGWVSAVDLSGNKSTLSGEWSAEEGLSWSADGNEVWFTAAKAGEPFSLRAVTTSRQERVIARAPTDLMLHDIARDGRVLFSAVQRSSDIIGLAPGETKERNLSWLDNVSARDISADGKTFVFSHFGTGSGPNYSTYLRATSGSPPIKLGDGAAWALSPDAKWVLAILSTPPQMVLLPTGAGAVQQLDRGGIEVYGIGAGWHPDGRQVVFNGREPGGVLRSYIQAVDGGQPRPLTPEGTTGTLIAPDGKSLVAQNPEGKLLIYPVDGTGNPRAITGLGAEAEVVRWGADSRTLYAVLSNELPATVYRVDLATGRKDTIVSLEPADPAGLLGPIHLVLSVDGKAYVYSMVRILTTLFLGEGLR